MLEYLTGDIELLRSLSVGYQSELEELKQKHYNLTVSYDRLVTSSSSNTTASDEPSLTVLNADRLSYPDNSSSDDHNSDDNNSDDSKDRIFRLFDV